MIFTLNVDGYSREITDLTYPLLKFYAKKIGADFYVISERRFPNWPVTYEKLQIFELGKIAQNDWNIFLDSDTLVHPETIDFTNYIPMDTVAHNGYDFANIRWRYDEYFRRDGRNIGSCNWAAFASSWCLDLWRPLDDLTFEEALENIYPTRNELNTVVTREHLIDDYTLSRNIARFGLKFKTLRDIEEKLDLKDAFFFYHQYTLTLREKVEDMKKVIESWKIPTTLR